MPAETDDLRDDLRALLNQRRDIDRALSERHSRAMAVLFTDIVGSTQFFEERGDVEGLARVHEHNDLLFPVVERNGGRVVKTIGDAIMAVFEEPTAAIDAAAEMQTALRDQQTNPDDPIRVRIGAHAGAVLVDGDDVFGDTVNTAARVASAADGDQVLLSEELYDLLPPTSDHRARPHGDLPFKGKAEPMPVVELLWSGEDLEITGEQALQAVVCELEVARAPDGGLRVSASDGGEDGAVRGYTDVDFAPERLAAATRHLGTLTHGGGERAYLDEVKQQGQRLFDEVLPAGAGERVRGTSRTFLRLRLDADLAPVPWELLHDGETFLGERFALGRVITAPDAGAAARAPDDGPLVVVSNPSGDLPAATREGDAVRRLLEDADAGEVVHREGPLAREDLLALVRGSRLLHFAGHAAGGALRVADGKVTGADLARATEDGPPRLVFANACRAATGGWQDPLDGVTSMAATLLTAGVGHYLAPLWDVPDDDAVFFSLRFYEGVIAGVPYGEAVRRARVALKKNRDARPLSFAGYTLYGDPRHSLAGVRPRAQRPRMRAATTSLSLGAAPPTPPPARAPHVAATDAPASGAPAPAQHTTLILLAGLVAVAVVAVLVFAFVRTPPAAPTPPPSAPSPAPVKPDAPVEPKEDPPPKPAGALRHEGPVRVSVLPFKQLGNEEDLDYLSGGLAEIVVTDLGGATGIKLIERAQIDVDIGEIEFGQSEYVDPATRAALGKIAGAEVVVLGSYQRAGDKMRFAARFVNTESGEILAVARADGAADDPFALQDKLAGAVRGVVTQVKEKMRP